MKRREFILIMKRRSWRGVSCGRLLIVGKAAWENMEMFPPMWTKMPPLPFLKFPKEMKKDCYNCDKYRTRFGKSCKDPIVRGCGKAPYKLCDDYIPCRNIKPHNLTYRGVPVLYAPNISV